MIWRLYWPVFFHGIVFRKTIIKKLYRKVDE